ncbi:hypothetical protein KKC59_01885 [bacterium]|nr:hypothetical protein [bacterium]
MIYFFIYLISAGVILVSGVKLVKTADQIASYFKLSKVWLGAVLVASITSLPELVTTFSSVWLNLPDMAVSNILGSNLFNVVILFCVLFFFSFNECNKKDKHHTILTIFFSIFFVLLAALFIKLKLKPSFFSMGVDSISILVVYVLFIKKLSEPEVYAEEVDEKKFDIKKAVFFFGLSALFISIGGVVSVLALDKFAELSGLSKAFTGLFFLAIATSLPEVVTAITAARMGSLCMVSGILIGSNLFNICIFCSADLLTKKNIFSIVHENNIVTCFFVVIITLMFAFPYIFRKTAHFLSLKKAAVIVILIYIVALYLSYRG